ncbi:MAG: RNA methyltransferase [Ruminococcus sp.]|nr:RNA methyltransferase [Ruminococcus sp.]
MVNIIRISDLSIKELQPYTAMGEKRLCTQEGGLFVAESIKVAATAIDAGYEPVSVLAEKKCIEGQGRELIGRMGDIPVYTAQSSVLTELTGFKMTQGMVCLMKRRQLLSPEHILRNASRVAVLEDVMNQTNVGAIFRAAAALGIDGVLLSPSCSDPLFRRSVRVSMGTVFQVPYAYFDCPSPEYIDLLHRYGFTAAAMALREDCMDLGSFDSTAYSRLALLLGTEGTGLREETVSACDMGLRIPMHNGVDSLNVAAAAAVAFWELRKR